MFSQQRAMGQYSTPQQTVHYMVDSVLSHLSNKKPDILDPSTGDGIFIQALLEAGVPSQQLHAYDIDTAVPIPESSIHFRHQDFIKVPNDTKFDAIIGNPPYKSKRQSPYFTKNRAFLEQEFYTIGVHNMYSLFIYKAIQLLKEDGILSMIVQDSFLTNVYYKYFREYLLHHTEIIEIILAPRRLFHKGKADVRTSILTLRKKKKPNMNTTIRLVDRLEDQHYASPPEERVQYISQDDFALLPNYNFAINVPLEIQSLFHSPYTPLEVVADIVTGISTGNDGYFLRKKEEMEYTDGWIPFYKNNGSKDAWYYEPKYYIHQNWEANYKRHPRFTIRNPSFFYKEGVTCSSMGVKFSASYMPKGSLFGVNANLFPKQQEDLMYFLGLLNSNLVKYMLRKVLNRTNMITCGYLKNLPYLEPSYTNKTIIKELAEDLVQRKKVTPDADTSGQEKEINEVIYDIYGISEESRHHIDEFCADMLEKL
ncbi:SAM-dependent methyltransferase [Halobacillus fulvus]|nr:SAM-dependent methyltransferase [Halobacillus fulvus]